MDIKMYTPKIIRDGIKALDIIDANEIFDIIQSCKINRNYLEKCADEKKKREAFINRFAIPRGLNKKEYKKILENTQDKINKLNEELKELGPDNGILVEIELDDYILKKSKLKKILTFHEEYGELNIKKAKEYPIEQLLDLDSTGSIKCLWHDEKTPSLKLDKKRNKVHCFGCQKDADSIDIYQKINNVDFNVAVKALCH